MAAVGSGKHTEYDYDVDINHTDNFTTFFSVKLKHNYKYCLLDKIKCSDGITVRQITDRIKFTAQRIEKWVLMLAERLWLNDRKG